MKTITSPDNPFYKQLRKLAESARERRKTNRTLLDGTHLLAAYLESGGRPVSTVVSQSGLEEPEIARLLQTLPQADLTVLPDALFREVSPVATPTGVLALIDIPRVKREKHPEFCVLLEDIQDPGNLGSILRSAAAAGVGCAYLSSHCADAWSPRVLRAAMGAHFVLGIEERADLWQVAEGFPGKVVATGLKAQRSLFEADLKGPVALAIGNEGAGLSEELLGKAQEVVRIPMPGGVESLNAAAAAAICLFERVRQVA